MVGQLFLFKISLIAVKTISNYMNKALFFLLFAAAVLPVVGQSTLSGSELGEKWTTYTAPDLAFELQAPGLLTEKTDTVSTPVGALVYRTAFLQHERPDADNLFYMVSYCEYPEGGIHADSTDILPEFFQATIESATLAVQGELIYSDPLNMDRYPGWQWRIDYLQGQVAIKTRAFVIGNRYYALQTIMYKNKSLNRSTQRFFQSFRLL
jgi:hypothetical protein